ncbi:MAG: helix-turn-helix domain-containing protein [Candidatus Orphnella occulta]|nr:helix-turn-helix domain-containing protein [Candidatus Orphnella occulta]
MEKLLTPTQLSESLQVSKSTIYQWIHRGFIPHYKYRKGIRSNEVELQRRSSKKNKGQNNLFDNSIKKP